MEFPLIVHQTWKNNTIPDRWKPLYDVWISFCQAFGYKHVLWTDDENRAMIEKYYPWFLTKYDSYRYPIQRADAVRYFILHKYGGVYSDLDMCPKKDKFQKLHELILHFGHSALSAMPITKNKVWKDTLTNSFMISQPHSPFMERLWESLMNPTKFHWTWIKIPLRALHKFEILLTTGPGIVSDQSLLHPKLVKSIPLNLIGNPSADTCLMDHEQGGSWHDPQQMQKDLYRLVFVSIVVVLFLVLFVFFILRATKRRSKK